ncbi:hypothetical protein RFI_31485, partial [Reticulomyxa filosa]
GHLGTDKLRWCVPHFAQEDADMVFWESLMNDAGSNRFSNLDLYEVWVRNVAQMPKHPTYGVINTGEAAGRYGDNCQGVEWCKMTEEVNIFWWAKIEPLYRDVTSMLTVAFQRGCSGKTDSVEPCKHLQITWHPGYILLYYFVVYVHIYVHIYAYIYKGPHGHRLNAEVLGHWLLKVTLEGLQKYASEIEKRLTKDGRPTLSLECLLADPSRKDVPKQPYFCNDKCREPSWCASTFFPAPIHTQLESFVLKGDGWISIDTTDKRTQPLILRTGGQNPIDHKIEFQTSTLGSELVIQVKVPTCCIVIPRSISQSGQEWHDQFEFKIDNERVECELGNDACTIRTGAGKHVLTVRYASKTKWDFASIDMIAAM